MAGQYEIVKIEEINPALAGPLFTPFNGVNVMDTARQAARKDQPRRSVIVLSSFAISLLGMATVVFVQHRYMDSIMEVVDNFRSKETVPQEKELPQD